MIDDRPTSVPIVRIREDKGCVLGRVQREHYLYFYGTSALEFVSAMTTQNLMCGLTDVNLLR